jgi:hypothetical protein
MTETTWLTESEFLETPIMISQDITVPLGTGYVGKTKLCKNHFAYLRHAVSDYTSAFYRYFVPTGHSEFQGFHKALNLRFL